MDEPELKNNPPRIALFLLGGGYRAMLFHLGALWRLNDFGLLRKLARISSVSGGSIVAGTLAARWRSLKFDNDIATNFETLIASAVRDVASTNLESSWHIAGRLSKNFKLAPARARYHELTHGISLAEIPEQPEFIFKATNLQTGGMWCFCRTCTGDPRVGEIREPRLSLATVVAASAALPPQPPVVLDPASMGNWSAPPPHPFSNPRFRNRVVLCDGSVSRDPDLTELASDDIVLLSDAGAVYRSEPRPALHWLNSRFVALAFSDVQIYERRKRELLAALSARKLRAGYWDIARSIETYGVSDALKCPADLTQPLAEVRTALHDIDAARQKDLIDWGFASCDAAIRASLVEFHFQSPDASPNGTFYRNRPTAGAATAA